MPNAASATLLAPAIGALLLIGYAAVATLAGRIAFERRDIEPKVRTADVAASRR